tara:strand:- start:85 stop:312 length:228 start_codon:yes stop_codon:yes gene_type:complete
MRTPRKSNHGTRRRSAVPNEEESQSPQQRPRPPRGSSDMGLRALDIDLQRKNRRPQPRTTQLTALPKTKRMNENQ